MPVPVNFHGKKGRSGRKSARVEFVKNEAIQKAWNKVNKEIESQPVDRIALPIALKDMTDKKDVSGQIALVQITGMEIKKDA